MHLFLIMLPLMSFTAATTVVKKDHGPVNGTVCRDKSYHDLVCLDAVNYVLCNGNFSFYQGVDPGLLCTTIGDMSVLVGDTTWRLRNTSRTSP